MHYNWSIAKGTMRPDFSVRFFLCPPDTKDVKFWPINHFQPDKNNFVNKIISRGFPFCFVFFPRFFFMYKLVLGVNRYRYRVSIDTVWVYDSSILNLVLIDTVDTAIRAKKKKKRNLKKKKRVNEGMQVSLNNLVGWIGLTWHIYKTIPLWPFYDHVETKKWCYY